ncbi:hypothetical protein EDD22DRAFT_878763 [Suillus occidentalis]|nr:hypothetical protein EDD22DRAFT_878763 [Suillus occidentalis]
MAKASRISSHFGSDAEKQSLYIPAKENKVHLQLSPVCRYFLAGRCRRGLACRFGHLQPQSVSQEYARPNEHVVHTRTCRYNAAGHCQRDSACHFVDSPPECVPQEYVYPNAHEVYTRTPHKGWDQDVGHSHGYTSYARYTVDPNIAPYGFGARYSFDSSSDVSSSDSSSSDQGLSATFRSMTIEEPVYSVYFPSALQYPNNTGTRYSDVSYPGYYRGYTPTGFKSRTATHKNAEQGKEKRSLYRTKPCKFFSTRQTCSEGNKCRFIHDVEKNRWARKADSQARGTAPSQLPSTPRSLQEELKARDYYPITWRVIGGGVMMGGYRLPCKAFAAGYCPDGNDCRLAHETEVWTSENGVVQLKTQTSATCPKPSLDSSTESQRSIISTDCSSSSPTIHDTDGGTSSSINDAETSTSAVNSDKVVPSQRRRTRSMSMPTSPTVLRAPHIFAEL